MSVTEEWRRPWPDRFGAFWQSRWPRLGPWLARIESRLLRDDLNEVHIERPVFIAGLPRSGSTILLEMIADAPGFTAHRYADFPLLWTPYAWNWLRQRLPLRAAARIERAHRDRILVNRDSPEAFEEPIWQQGFPHLHQEMQSEILDAQTDSADFEQLFKDHIRKLLMVRASARYVSKGNYSVLRLGYLAKLFPDARLLVPLRAPEAHVASLLKQERLYASAPEKVLRHIGRIGHHEFGKYRRVLHLGDAEAFAQTREDFSQGRMARAWLRTWVCVYRWLADTLMHDAALAERVLLVDYDQLCANSANTLSRIGQHVALPAQDLAELVQRWSSRLSQPDYYQREPMQEIEPELLATAHSLHERLLEMAQLRARVEQALPMA
jgi:Sulfotransferase family